VKLTAPELMAEHHDPAAFASGDASLDVWLQRCAMKNQKTGASRTFVVCDAAGRVQAYYALASSVLAVSEATGKFKRNMPDPIPVVVLGRLAVDLGLQGQGIGRALVRDAALRVVQSAHLIGIRGMLIHAISTDAKNFYERLGFDVSPMDAMMLMATLADLQANL